MATPRVTDKQRQQLEDDVAAAMLLIYTGAARQTFQAAGIDEEPVISAGAKKAIRILAHEQSLLDQEGINVRIQAVLSVIEHPDEADALLVDLRKEFLDHWNTDKAKYLASTAFHRGQHDTLTSTNGPDGKPLAETQQFAWSQFSENPDSCADADGASPGTYSNLVDIAGGYPPIHRGCGCSLGPA